MELLDPFPHPLTLTHNPASPKINQIQSFTFGSRQFLDFLGNIFMPCSSFHLLRPSHPPSPFYHIHFQDRKFFKGFFSKVSYCFVCLSVFLFIISIIIIIIIFLPLTLHPLITSEGWKKTHAFIIQGESVWGETNVMMHVAVSRWGGLGWGRALFCCVFVCVWY